MRARQSTGYGIDVFNVNDGARQDLFSLGIVPLGDLALSPEGARLAFQAQVEGDMELYLAIIPTNEFVRLTSFPAFDGEPAWTNQ